MTSWLVHMGVHRFVIRDEPDRARAEQVLGERCAANGLERQDATFLELDDNGEVIR